MSKSIWNRCYLYNECEHNWQKKCRKYPLPKYIECTTINKCTVGECYVLRLHAYAVFDVMHHYRVFFAAFFYLNNLLLKYFIFVVTEAIWWMKWIYIFHMGHRQSISVFEPPTIRHCLFRSSLLLSFNRYWMKWTNNKNITEKDVFDGNLKPNCSNCALDNVSLR